MNNIRSSLSLIAVLSVTGCATIHFTPDRAGGFVARETAGHKHFVYLPADWSADKTWPVIVYLHGGGERGSDGVKPTQVGLGPVVWKQKGQFPFIVVFPQCNWGTYWPEAKMRQRVLDSLADAIAEFHGDPARVYLTGNSMGGFGTWTIAAHNPGRFAALAPIAGGVIPPFGGKIPPDALFKKGEDPEAAVARAVGKTPIWIFHGAKDWLVSPANGRRMRDKVQAAGGDVRFTEFAGVGHNSEDSAYVMPALFDWFRAQHL